MSEAVVWQQLELYGFGRHLSLDVAFGDGLTTLVAPNEFGKSTLVAGLAATLFGLPHVSDATKFGRERFRNWANPSRFEGEVAFLARDGTAYMVHRNFETHEVRIVRRDAQGAEEVFEGMHNPIARTGTDAYEAHMEALLGMADRAAFQQSFHVAQPLPPPDGLGEEVQRLLSGSGRATFDAALDELANAVKERTNATGDLGVTSRNLRNPRRLQECEELLQRLRRDLSEGRQAADASKEVASQLAELEEKRTGLLTQQQALGARIDAHRAWLTRKDAYATAAQTHLDLQSAVREAKGLDKRIEERTSAIRAEWPAFAGAEDDLEPELAAAKEASEDRLERAEAVTEAQKAVANWSSRAAEHKAAVDEHEAARPEGPGAWDADALRELRADAERAVRDWDRQVELAQDVERREQDIERFDTLADADAATLNLLRNYPYERERLARAAENERRAAEVVVTRPEAQGNPVVRWAVAAILGLVASGVAFGFADNLVWAVAAFLAVGGATYALGPGRQGPGRAGRGRPAKDEVPEPSNASNAHRFSGAGPAQQELDAFLEATQPYLTSLADVGEPATAVRAWEDALRDLEQERRRHADHAQRVWGVDPDGVEQEHPLKLAGAWGNLADYASSKGAEVDSLEGLASWLTARDATVWDTDVQRAETSEEALATWQAAHAKLEREADLAESREEGAREALERAQAALERAQAVEATAREAIADLLATTGATPSELLAQWRAYRAQVAGRDGLKEQLGGLLKGRSVDAIDALEQAEYEASLAVMEIRRAVEELREAHPELPPIGDDRADVARPLHDLVADKQTLAAEIDAVGSQIFDLGKERSVLEGKDLVNIARVEVEITELEAELASVRAEIDALVVAHQELSAAVQDFQSKHRERLELAATRHLQTFSGSSERRVQLGESFAVTILEPGGTRIHPVQLSQGTQDQLVIALRLAIADLLSDDAPLPLLLDDPFLNWDAQRLAQVKGVLLDLARERQVILLSHREEFGDWGEPAEIRS